MKYNDLLLEFDKKIKHCLGYPCNQNFDFSQFAPFLNYHINNVGSSFQPNIPYALNTHKYEVEVIKHFVELYGGDIETYKGYLGSGSTEMNLYGMYLGREHFNNNCTVIHSSSAHYSIPKAAKLLGLQTSVIQSQSSGEFNYDAFDDLLNNHSNDLPYFDVELNRLIEPINHSGLIIMVTLGTTMTCAIDNIDKIINICNKYNVKYYIHCDAAFLGPMLPYMKGSEDILPSFSKGNIDSISMSAHKFIGCPVPCGILLSKESHMEKVCQQIEYIHSSDYTISGSRNGLAALLLYEQLKTTNFKKEIKKCMKLSNYTVAKINKNAGYQMAWKHKFSTTIIIEKPNDDIVKKWFLATENDIAHLIISPQTTKKIIKKFCKDLKEQ